MYSMENLSLEPIKSFAVLRKIGVIAITWLILISCLHYLLNAEKNKKNVVRMGYMPVITNLSAPLLDYASKNKATKFEALKFSSFAEMGEAFRAHKIDVAFIIAPLAIVLRQQGVPLKVVYIGNRHESTLVVSSNESISSIADLRGKTVAVPMRYSCHNLLLLKLAEEYHLRNSGFRIVEMQPPDMASALSARSLDGYFVGEPFAAQTIKNGKSKVLFYVEQKWPNFICNVMIVHDCFISKKPAVVQKLVSGAIRAGLWASEHTNDAAQIVSRYWNQDTDLVKFALNTPPNRINFKAYKPRKDEFAEIAKLMVRFGLMDKCTIIDSLIDPSFCDRTQTDKEISLKDIIP